MNILETLFIKPVKNSFEDIMKFLPTVLTSFLILIVGIIVAVCLKAIFYRIFRAFRLDGVFERLGLSELLRRSGISDGISTLLSRLIGWLTFFVFVLTAINTLQIRAIGRLFENFLFYLPQFFIALFIFLAGYLLSNFIYRTVLIAAVNADNRFAKPVSTVVKYAVVILAATMAIEQLGAGKETVVIAFAILFGGAVLACAIAFGLGARDIAKKYLESHLKEEKKEKEDDISHL